MEASARMRVLLFGPPTVHLLRWRKLAEDAGFETYLIAYDTPHPKASAHIPALPSGRVRLVGALIASALRFRRLVRRSHPDVVHAHWLTGPGWIAAVAGVRPLVVTAWGSDALRWTPASRFARSLAWLVGGRAVALTYDANSVAEALAAANIPIAHLARVVNGADARSFHPRTPQRDLVRRLGVPDDAPVVLSARGLDPVYRQDVVVSAFAQLVTRTRATLLVRAETGDDRRRELLTLATALGVADRVVTYNSVSEDELPILLSSVDVAVSVPESDATSVLLLECLLSETPTIVSDLPANREWVPAETGWLVPIADDRALASALRRVLDDPASARAAASVAAKGVRERGTADQQREAISALYRRVAAASRAAPARS